MRESLLKVGKVYAYAKQEKFGGHPLSDFIRRQLKDDVKQALGDSSSEFKIYSSAGAGQWAHVPWVAIFDPMVTGKATKGYYVVYLFAHSKGEIHLSLNQGTTSIIEEFVTTRGLTLLKDKATLMSACLNDFVSHFDTYNLDLGYNSSLPRGYEAGHAFGRVYRIDSLPTEEVLRADLQLMVNAYLSLTFRGGLDSSTETTNNNTGYNAVTITEVRQYHMHKRIDRHPKASKEVKAHHGTICQACNFDFASQYGELGADFIEAHHLQPLSKLQEGVPFHGFVAWLCWLPLDGFGHTQVGKAVQTSRFDAGLALLISQYAG
jgi:5-methylcytosine-specific restriction protein A